MPEDYFHVTFNVADLDRTIWLYRDIIGLPLARAITTGQGMRIAYFDFGESFVAMLEPVSPTRATQASPTGPPWAGFVHFGIHVDDADAMYRRLLEKDVVERGVRCLREPRTHQSNKSFLFADPDGITVAIQETHQRSH